MVVVWYALLAVTAVLTITTGNLFAMRQQNIKRFLAFSSVAQVGFILIGLTGGSKEGMASSIYFLVIYRGFYKTNPFLSWVLTIALFSLAGVPPTAGFFGKFFLLTAGASTGNYILIAIAAVNMIVSMYYYLRVVKAIFMDQNDSPVAFINTGWMPRISLLLCLIGIIVTGFMGDVYTYIHQLSFGI
jgi:NADH-quinone oxidoreductase subunit N